MQKLLKRSDPILLNQLEVEAASFDARSMRLSYKGMREINKTRFLRRG